MRGRICTSKAPTDLVDTLGAGQIWKAPRAANQREGIQRHLPDRAQLQTTFEYARRPRLSADDARRVMAEWARRTTRETYGNGPPITILLDALAKVQYPGLDLSHLSAVAEP